MAATELTRQGWHLTDGGIREIETKGNSSLKIALDTDLKDIGEPWLPSEINKGRVDYVEGPGVLQLCKLRIISAPKENEESQAAPKLYRLSLTDGHVTCSAVTLDSIKGLGLNTPPGSKFHLSGTVEVESNFLLLTCKNTTLLGGWVRSLAEPWQLKKDLAKQSQSRNRGESGPPPFVPFGNKIASQMLPPSRKDNFKSLGGGKEKKAEVSDTEFEQQRQAALMEALQAKGSSKGGKIFGGGKLLVNDQDVARIAEMGFSIDEATTALKSSGGNVDNAINSLLSGGFYRSQRPGDRGRPAFRGGGGEARGEGRRWRKDRDQDEDIEDSVSSRPSGPATLFDFLEVKIPTSKDDSKKNNKPSDTKVPLSSSFNNDASIKFNKEYPGDKPARVFSSESSTGSQPASQSRNGSAGTYQDSFRRGKVDGGACSRVQASQQQQNVPPRFAKLGRGDGLRTGSGRNDGADGYRGGERFDTYSDKRYNSRVDNYPPNDGREVLKENIQSLGGRDNQRFTGPNRKSNYERHSEKRYEQDFSGSCKSNSQPLNSREDFNRNSSREGVSKLDVGGARQREGSRQGDSSSTKDNYGNSQSRNASRVEQRDDTVQYNRDQPANRKGYNQQPSAFLSTQHPQQSSAIIPSQYPHQSPYTGKSAYEDRHFTPGGNMNIKVGDPCLAKYWEDEEFYPAIVEALATDGSTAVVYFVEYGNQEEVLIEDVQPLPSFQPWPYSFGMTRPNSSVQEFSFPGSPSFVPPMEFVRGRAYNNNSNNNSERRRHDNNTERRIPGPGFSQPANQRRY